MNTKSVKESPHLRGNNSNLVRQEEQRQDLGFGTKINDSFSRLINKDGSFNIRRSNETFWDRVNIYNRLITMRWRPFLALVLLFYITENLVFATLYVLAGVENLRGLDQVTDGTPAGRSGVRSFSVRKQSPPLAMATSARRVI